MEAAPEGDAEMQGSSLEKPHTPSITLRHGPLIKTLPILDKPASLRWTRSALGGMIDWSICVCLTASLRTHLGCRAAFGLIYEHCRRTCVSLKAQFDEKKKRKTISLLTVGTFSYGLAIPLSSTRGQALSSVRVEEVLPL